VPEVYRYPGRYTQAFQDAAIQNLMAFSLRIISNTFLATKSRVTMYELAQTAPLGHPELPAAGERIPGGMRFDGSLIGDLKLIDLSHEL